jgi:hypothetical protein
MSYFNPVGLIINTINLSVILGVKVGLCLSEGRTEIESEENI